MKHVRRKWRQHNNVKGGEPGCSESKSQGIEREREILNSKQLPSEVWREQENGIKEKRKDGNDFSFEMSEILKTRLTRLKCQEERYKAF